MTFQGLIRSPSRAVSYVPSRAPDDGVGYLPEAVALFARMTAQPDGTRKGHINTLIRSLKATGVWANLDVLNVMAAHDAQAARRNWIADAYNLTAVSAPTFTTDRGYTGDGSTSYLTTGFNPTTASSPKFTQNSACMFIWSRTNSQNGAGASQDIGNANSAIVRATDGTAGVRPNTAAGVTTANQNYPNLVGWRRSGASAWAAFEAGGSVVDSGTDASAALTNDAFKVCARSTAFGVNQLAVVGWGASLTNQNLTDLNSALSAYLTAIGAA